MPRLMTHDASISLGLNVTIVPPRDVAHRDRYASINHFYIFCISSEILWHPLPLDRVEDLC